MRHSDSRDSQKVAAVIERDTKKGSAVVALERSGSPIERILRYVRETVRGLGGASKNCEHGKTH
jgi:hypothetical protein